MGNPSRYFFILRWPDREHDDPDGTPLPNKEAALAYAERIVRELKEAGGYDDPDLMMIVQDSAGETIFSIAF